MIAWFGRAAFAAIVVFGAARADAQITTVMDPPKRVDPSNTSRRNAREVAQDSIAPRDHDRHEGVGRFGRQGARRGPDPDGRVRDGQGATSAAQAQRASRRTDSATAAPAGGCADRVPRRRARPEHGYTCSHRGARRRSHAAHWESRSRACPGQPRCRAQRLMTEHERYGQSLRGRTASTLPFPAAHCSSWSQERPSPVRPLRVTRRDPRAPGRARSRRAVASRASRVEVARGWATARGTPVARLVIPRIGLDEVVVEGVSDEDLSAGPGHMTGARFRATAGNAVISAHRDRHFHPLGRIVVGDTIVTESDRGTVDMAGRSTPRCRRGRSSSAHERDAVADAHDVLANSLLRTGAGSADRRGDSFVIPKPSRSLIARTEGSRSGR